MTFFGRLKNSLELLKLSFHFLGKDKSLLIVPIMLPALNILTFIVLILAGLGFLSKTSEQFMGVYGTIVIFTFLAVFFFVMSLVNTFFGAVHSWMVFEVVKGEDTTFKNGLRRASQNIKDIIFFSLSMMAIRLVTFYMRGRKKEGLDIGFYIRSTFAGWIDTLATILGKLVLPAMIITEMSFTEAVADLKRASKTWPEILTFEIGVQPIVNMITTIITIPLILLTIISFPSIISWIFITLIIMTILTGSVLKSFLNATYYALLYIALIEGKKMKNSSAVFEVIK
ncbi:hypothetical protein HY483_01510 [Candidatus Woesearchaeota archaeon]|nr:hypothetical protein [Candidatus Woesearchaeota archaeon]